MQMARRKSQPSPLLERYAPFAEAITLLFYPHAEVVLHDIASDRIIGIWNAFSKRRVGDASLIGEDIDDFPPGHVWGPFEKTGPAGERLKSISVFVTEPGKRSRAAALLCVNLDVSRLDAAARLLAAFAAPPTEQISAAFAGSAMGALASFSTARAERPAVLFAKEWREQMQTALHDWLRSQRLSLAALTPEERVAVVDFLDQKGLFGARHAADHAATLLGISRSSFYNALREARTADKRTRRRSTQFP
jgi:predicted transcriptional regulator YheO